MKFVLSVVVASLLASPSYAAETDGCDSSVQLEEHATAVKEMLDDVRAGKTRQFDSLVPGEFYIRGLDLTQEPPVRTTSRFDAAYLKNLLSSGTYTINPMETVAPYFCGSIVVKWTRSKKAKPYWMTTFTFRNNALAEVTEADLVLLGKRLPPVITPVAPPRPNN